MVISGTLLIWGIKFAIRPFYFADNPVSFFPGIAPNLLGSFLILFGAYWFFYGKGFFIARVFRIQSNYDLRFVCLLGFGLLIINEYLQLIPFFGRTFDLFDIIFSLAGLCVAYFMFTKALRKYPELKWSNDSA